MTLDLQSRAGRFIRSPSGLVLLVFLAVTGLFLAVEHTAHLFGVLPYALLLLCPLLHLFMHSGHGGRGGPDDGHAGHGGGQPPPAAGGGR